MGAGKVLALAAALATGALLQAGPAAAKCRLAKYFDLPVAMEGPRAIIPVTINGVEVRLMVDTGDFYSMLTPEAAKRLNIRGAPLPGLRVKGVGGEDFVDLGEAKEFVFAGVPLKHIEFIIGGRSFAPGTAGLLGENVLSVADVEYDLAHGMMRFFKEQECSSADLAYWASGSADSIHIDPIVLPLKPNIIGTVKVNGKAVRAMFDSGAPTSVLSLSAAGRAGIRVDGAGVEAAGLSKGIGREARESWIAPVESFAIGGEEIKNTQLRVSKMDLDDVDMLLGMDFFLSHRILVSHNQNRLYFSYNGGPVFRLDQTPSAPAAVPASTAAGASGPAAQAASGGEDAEALGREGEALMARREYAQALDAFDKAAALDPKTPRRYLDRAHARQALGRAILAMADYDRALELKPDYAAALLERGELFLRNGDLPRAQADFDAALKVADDSSLRLRIAAAFDRNGRYALAIEQFDAWIAANRNDDELWEGYLGRCRARLMSGQELEKAASDCDAAVRKAPRNSSVFEARGLVRLRLGQLKEAVADYDVALRLQPKLALALYGRGLAKKRLGLIGEGEADIQAGLALDPKLPATARRMGLIEDGKKPEAGASSPAGKR